MNNARILKQQPVGDFAKSLIFTIGILLAAVLIASPSQAKTVSYFKTAKNGKSKWIDSYFGWKNNCGFKTIDVDIVDRPDHGSVSPRVETKKISRAQVGSAGKCIGKPTKAVSVYYKAKKGYRGSDKFKVRMKVRGEPPVYFIYRVRVN